MAIDSTALSQIWQDLRPHLEWASGFSLVFLFADQPAAVTALRELYGDSLHLRALRLRELKPSNSTELASLAEEMLKTRVGYGPLWVELWQGGESANAVELSKSIPSPNGGGLGWGREKTEASLLVDRPPPNLPPVGGGTHSTALVEAADWNRQRILFLHRLNENRSALEQNIRQPVVIVLPVAERLAVSVHAPDLWAVRSFTKQLPTLAPSRPDTSLPPIGESKTGMALATEPSPAEQEWTRLLSLNQNTDGLNLWDGFAAFDAALERGSLDAARHIANETLTMARQRSKPKAGFFSRWLKSTDSTADPPSPARPLRLAQ